MTGEVATRETDARHLAELMVGRRVASGIRRGARRQAGVPAGQPSGGIADGDSGESDDRIASSGSAGTDLPALEAVGLRLVAGDQVLLGGIDLAVQAGEVVGVAGVAGNGQRELANTLAGITPPTSGTVRVGSVATTGRGATAARHAGLAFVPEDRLGTGLVPALSLTDNMLLTRPRSFFVNRRQARRQMAEAIEQFDIKAPGTEASARVLSGGNAQKVLLARELAHIGVDGGPRVIIVSAPTRGLDIGAAEQVRSLLHEARLRGGAVLIISEDLDEVRSLADRMVVLYRGRVALEGPTDDLGIEAIGLAMAGVDPAAAGGEVGGPGVEPAATGGEVGGPGVEPGIEPEPVAP